jgi:hypothetical protein
MRLKSNQKKSVQKKSFLEHLDIRLDRAIAEAEGRFKGEVFDVGTMGADGSRPMLNKSLEKVGSVAGSGQKVDTWGPGNEPQKQIHPPKKSGWDISWEDMGQSKTFAGLKQGVIGNQKDGRYFPFSENDTPCVVCGGKGKILPPTLPGATSAPKGKPCAACYGVGRRNKLVDQFIASIKAQGKKPVVRAHRGKDQSFSTAGSENVDHLRETPPSDKR